MHFVGNNDIQLILFIITSVNIQPREISVYIYIINIGNVWMFAFKYCYPTTNILIFTQFNIL